MYLNVAARPRLRCFTSSPSRSFAPSEPLASQSGSLVAPVSTTSPRFGPHTRLLIWSHPTRPPDTRRQYRNRAKGDDAVSFHIGPSCDPNQILQEEYPVRADFLNTHDSSRSEPVQESTAPNAGLPGLFRGHPVYIDHGIADCIGLARGNLTRQIVVNIRDIILDLAK